MKTKIIKTLFGIMFCTVFTGCGLDGGEGVNNIDNEESAVETVDDIESEAEDYELAGANLLRFMFNGHPYELNVPFSQIFDNAQNNGDYIVNVRTARLLNSDGSDSETNAMDLDDWDRSKCIAANVVSFDDGFSSMSFYFEQDDLSLVITGDDIIGITSIKNIPDYYILLGDDNVSLDGSYAVLVKDNVIENVQDYLEQLPDTMDSEIQNDINLIIGDMELISQFKPIIFQGPWKDTFEEYYNNSPNYKENVAFLQAIDDAYQCVLSGENDSFGVIYIHCKEGKINKIYYNVFEKES